MSVLCVNVRVLCLRVVLGVVTYRVQLDIISPLVCVLLSLFLFHFFSLFPLLLFQVPGIDLDAVDDFGKTALRLAAQVIGYTSIGNQSLLKYTCNFGKTALSL